jgi:glycosyltransferase involved in cell wall biosynthesis
MAKQIELVSVGPDMQVQGGISRVIELICKNVPAHIQFRHIPTFTRYTGADGVDPADRGSRGSQALVYLRAFASIVTVAVGRKAAVFHVHFAGHGSLIRKGMICVLLRRLGCTYAVHSHAAETTLFEPWVPQSCRRLLLWGLRGAHRVIVLTQFWRDYYASLLELPPGRFLLLPNPADLPEKVPDRLHKHGLKLLFLGRIGERKGAFDLIRAFAQLPEDVRNNCSLTLAGDGEVNAAASLAASLGCSEQITARGWVTAKQVEDLLRESDVFILPSRAEGMSMALMEAMSWALAVVTTNAGGAQEFLENGQNSLLVEPGDVGGISEAICHLLRNPQMRVALGKGARETVAQFSIDSYGTKLIALYEELACARTASPAVPDSRAGGERALPRVRPATETTRQSRII